MVFPDPYPSPPEPQAFSPMTDAPKEDDWMAQWIQASGSVQPELVDGTNFDFANLDALFPWQQCGRLSEPPIPNSQPGSDLDLDWIAMLAGGMPGNNAGFNYLAAAPATATATVPAPVPLDINIDNINDFLFDLPEWDSTLSLTPGLTDDSSATSPQSDSTGDQLLPFPTYDAAASQFVPSPATPPSNFDFSSVFQSEKATCTLPSRLIEAGIDFTGQTQPDYASMYGNTRIEAGLDMATPIDASSGMEATSTDGVWVSETVLGKRSRERYGTHPNRSVAPDDDDSSSNEPQEIGKLTTDGVLEAAGSTKRIRRTPAIRTQQIFNGKSKAVGRGAERLTSTTARGVYHRSLSGPSVPQGSVGALAQGKPSWTEEREQEETRHDTDSNLPHERQNPEIAEDPSGHAIPTTLTTWQRLLLQTTQPDVERGAVSVIKCRLCPTESFKTWACFTRHCKDCEEHPAKIKCCERCGIYFGRQDSKKRHTDSATKACCAATPAEAAWRKHRAGQLLAAFQARVEYCLGTGEELGPKFAAIARAELPSKSKKVILSKKRRSEGKDSQD